MRTVTCSDLAMSFMRRTRHTPCDAPKEKLWEL